MAEVVIEAPSSERELCERAAGWAGASLAEAARALGVPVPGVMLHAKGWAGQLMERLLGATAASRALPDFPELGVELKTLPVTRLGRPCESTFVCTIPLDGIGTAEWDASSVRLKLERVLWLPIEGEREIPLGQRRIGQPLLWSPNAEQESLLRFDWEELAGMIGRGELDAITGHLGQYLQVRPKAANSLARRSARGPEGERATAMPRGFYLRARFTARILSEHFHLPSLD